MTGEEKVVKHLEMIQSVVNRLGRNAFMLKGWSMTILVVTVALMAKYEYPHNPYIVLLLILPIIAFWILDGYFLWHENLFLKVYDAVRCRSETDFAMDIKQYKSEPKCKWRNAVFSVTLVLFYMTEVLFTVAVFLFLVWRPT